MTVAHLELVGTAVRLRTLNVRQERMTAEKYAWDLEWSTINSIESLNKNTHNPIFFCSLLSITCWARWFSLWYVLFLDVNAVELLNCLFPFPFPYIKYNARNAGF